MILGTGTDIIELKRIEELLERNDQLMKRVLTPLEIECVSGLRGRRRVEFVAGRFAAKEAISKALGTGIGQHFGWQSVSILPKENGAPEISWHSETPPYKVHLSISHSDLLALAFVVLEEKK